MGILRLTRNTMIIFYARPTCPYCAKVRSVLDELGISYDEKDINNEEVLQDLLARGGKKMVPYIVDDETGTEMYESDDIVTYLKEQYGKN